MTRKKTEPKTFTFDLPGRAHPSELQVQTRLEVDRASRRVLAVLAVVAVVLALPSMTMNEAQLQRTIVDLAHLRSWKVAHFRPARTAAGWATPVAYDGAGFPDLVLVRDRIIYAEIKATAGRLRPEQVQWTDWLVTAGAEHHVWREADLPDIARILR